MCVPRSFCATGKLLYGLALFTLPRCSKCATGELSNDIEGISVIEGHELAESITDPAGSLVDTILGNEPINIGWADRER